MSRHGRRETQSFELWVGFCCLKKISEVITFDRFITMLKEMSYVLNSAHKQREMV